MSYSHLTENERYQISALRRKQCSVGEIGRLLNRDKGTISRELRRNHGDRGYRPKQAQEKAQARVSEANAGNVRKISDETWVEAKRMLRLDHSPEQVSGRLKLIKGGSVSHETLYQRIYADKSAGGDLHSHLRCQKKRRKRYASGQQRRGTIPDRVGIEERPASVEDRAQIGHWEMDSIVGCNHKGFLVSMVERKSRIVFTAHVARKTAELVAAAIIETLSPIAGLVMTLTFDNGKEFALHKKVAEKLKCKTYFADPYTSCQRATNENTNGLIRQYVPKKTSFADLTEVHTRWIDAQLNSRPRKCLDYQTPSEVLLKSIIRRGVALRA